MGLAALRDFQELQTRLGDVLKLNRAESTVEHVVVALPSFSVGESLLSHYVERIPALEHRYLLSVLMLPRIASCELVFVSSRAPSPEVVDYYISLMPPDRRASARMRFRVLEVPDPSGRAVAAKLLDRPDLIDALRDELRGRPALIEPWNVTQAEVEVARRLDVPINGTSPELWPLGFKSAGRRLFAGAGVPVPFGCEDLCCVDDLVEAIALLRANRPTASGAVVKLDDSGAGDGNVVIDLREPGGVRTSLESLPEWYLRDLRSGCVVEELISGSRFASPSAQIDLLPDGTVTVVATHEQVLGGSAGQIYMGCRFPADPAYSARLAEYARRVGNALAREGGVGRVSVDFAAAQDAAGHWAVYALEMNIRKGGTTHPFAALRNLVPGHYDVEAGQWVAAADGQQRAYWSTDNLVDPAWTGVEPKVVIQALVAAGLQFDHTSGVGVVLHMLSGLAIDGRIGLTAIGGSPQHAGELYEQAATAVAEAVGSALSRELKPSGESMPSV